MKSIVIFIISILVLNICPAHAEPSKHEPLKLGIILPLSGVLSDYGTSSKNFIDLAFEDYPELRDQITIAYEDSAYDTATSITAYRKLIGANKVDVVYAFGAKMLEGLAPLADRDQIPFYSPELNSEFAYKYLHTLMFMRDIDDFSKSMWKALRDKGYKKVLLIRNENQFYNTWANGVIRNALPGETAVDYLSVLPGTTDFRTQLLRIKKEKFDALGLFLLPGGSQRAFVSQFSNFKMSYPIFGADALAYKDENKGYFNVIEGAFITAPYIPENFLKRYSDKYGYHTSISYSIQAYRFVLLMGHLAKSLEPDTKLTIEKIISESEKYQEELAKETGQAEKKEVMDFKFEIVKKDAKEGSARYYKFPIGNYEIRNGDMVLKEKMNVGDFR